jgi:hypothetical protein
VHEDYHRPGDEPQKIDYQKMEKVTRTVYMMLWEVANRATRVKVDKQLPAAAPAGGIVFSRYASRQTASVIV